MALVGLPLTNAGQEQSQRSANLYIFMLLVTITIQASIPTPDPCERALWQGGERCEGDPSLVSPIPTQILTKPGPNPNKPNQISLTPTGNPLNQ